MAGLTYYELLSLPQRFAIDAAELERNYLARNRELHPDFHQQESSAQQRSSLEMTAALNEAYAALKSPYRRAEYLLSLHGGPTAAESKEMPPPFLEEMLELRMEIEELRHQGAADSLERTALERQLRERFDKLLSEVGQRFAEYETLTSDDSKSKSVLLQVRRLLNSAKYIQGLLRDLRAD